jgi:molybdopterin-synthase adenylyltransferase
VTFSEDEIERYARHLVLADVGGPGQQRLKAARVLIVGMGGVGGPAALYLASAGIGTLGLVDDDTVSLSNLQRQIQFETVDVDRSKVEVSARRLTALNPHVEIQTFAERLSADTASLRVAGWDLVIDGTDDFETRMAVNAACVQARVPLVSGALGAWSGQVAVFEGRPCYRCLVPDIPPDAETCARVGVIGALAGFIGSLVALEAIKRLAGAGETLTGRLWIHDALTGRSRTVRIAADPACPVCR